MNERRKQDIETLSPLSPLQQGMLFHALERGPADPYLYQFRFDFEGDLDPQRFEQAWALAARRHQVLRADYRWEEVATPLQIVYRQRPVHIECLDWRDADAATRQAREQALLAEERRRGFDFRQAADLRLRLLRCGEREWRLLWTLHHIALDGWSVGLVLRDVLSAYQALSDGRSLPAGAAPAYSRYVEWLQQQDRGAAQAYWRGLLAGAEWPTRLDIGEPAPGGAGTAHYAEQCQTLDSVAMTQLQTATRARGMTLNTLVQAAWAILLARHADRDEVVFGTTVSGRHAPLPGIEELAGLCINTVPMRVAVPPRQPLIDLLQTIQTQGADSREHEWLPLSEIQRQVALEDGQGLFESIVVFENYPVDALLRRPLAGLTARKVASGELRADGVRLIGGRNNYPLSLIVAPGAELSLTLAYSCERFGHVDAARLLTRLRGLLLNLSRLLNEDEQATLDAVTLDDAAAPLQGEALALAAPDVLTAFARHLEADPEAEAVVDGEGRWSRRELDQHAAAVAAWLRQQGLKPEDRVAVCAERSRPWLASVLGILQAGGLWVALDPQWPTPRVRELLDESGARWLLASGDSARRLGADGLERLDVSTLAPLVQCADRRAAAPWPQQGAYLIYTSGSTGRPKGVTVSHAALAGYSAGFLARAALPPGSRLAMISTPAADLGHSPLFGALFGGHTLALVPPDGAFDAERLATWLHQERIDALKLVPSHLRGLLATGADVLPQQLLVLGGEASDGELIAWIRRLRPGLRILNHYGPTETTVGVLTHELEASDGVSGGASEGVAAIPTGRPLPGVRVRILDHALQPLPVGVDGELYIGGASVARGYWNRPGLTAERFVPDPNGRGARQYRSGDRVRLDARGRIHYRGRSDDQLKIRGYRIEPGEVAQCLRSLPGVEDAAVLARPDDEGRVQLIGYVVGAGLDTSAALDTLQQQLCERLPEAARPAQLLRLERLPLTPNGKLDRRALPAPAAPGAAAAAAGPQTDTERRLAAIWQQILKVDDIGREDRFFARGGDSLLSLRVIAAARRQGLALNPKRLLGGGTLAELAQQIDAEASATAGAGASGAGVASASPEPASITPVDRSRPLPLSYAQQRLWFLWKLDPDSAAYNIGSALRLHGALDPAALQQALDALLLRHESLRTRFSLQGDVPMQQVGPAGSSPIEIVPMAADAAASAVTDQAASFIQRPFDLGSGVLLRVQLLRLSAREHVLVVAMHHIITDGWSLNVVIEEFGRLYAGHCRGQRVSLPPLPIQYVDYAQWQRSWLAAGEGERQLAYWKQRLGGEQPVLELPTDHPRTLRADAPGARLRFELSADELTRLRTAAQSRGMSIFMLLLAALDLLLYRYSGQRDLRIGVPVANRQRPETQSLVGFFVNTQVLRTEVDAGLPGEALLSRVREAVLGAQEHQDLPFEQLVEALQPERALGRSPLFQILFNHRRRGESLATFMSDGGAASGEGLRGEPVEWGAGTVKFDLSLDTAEVADAAGERLLGAWTYRADLFEPATIERLARHFRQLLRGLCEQPERPIGELPMLDRDERTQAARVAGESVLADWDGGLPALVAAQARLRPQAPALVAGGETLSYAELERRAGALASLLRARGIGPEQRVGLLAERRALTLVALLAILKAGAAYVPLDPDMPDERLAWMARDAHLALLLAEPGQAGRLPASIPFVDLCAATEGRGDASDPEPGADAPIRPGQLAYLIYTSGSTGRPKGVMVSHANLRHYLHGLLQRIPLAETSRLAMVSTLAADLGHTVLFGAWAVGGCLHVLDRETATDARRFHAYAQSQQLDALKIVPGHLAALLSVLPETPLPWRCVVLGGEACTPELLERLRRAAPQCRIYNHYGPTETTVGVVATRLQPQANIALGQPLAHVRAEVLDGSLQRVPAAMAGELGIGGAGVARGYWNRPGLTAERFVPDPFGPPGTRLYRSGDRVRVNAEGALDYLGRVDRQLKIRGYRVEPGAVEVEIAALPGVRAAVVLARSTAAGPCLQACVVPADAARLEDVSWSEQLRALLRRQLPEAQVPAQWRVLEALPLTANGKPDRAALAHRCALSEPLAEPAPRRAPRTAMEQTVATIWSEVLGCPLPALDDHFFELGGHSLALIQVQARLREATGADLPVRRFFEALSVEALAAAAEAALAEARQAPAALQTMAALLDALE